MHHLDHRRLDRHDGRPAPARGVVRLPAPQLAEAEVEGAAARPVTARPPLPSPPASAMVPRAGTGPVTVTG